MSQFVTIIHTAARMAHSKHVRPHSKHVRPGTKYDKNRYATFFLEMQHEDTFRGVMETYKSK